MIKTTSKWSSNHQSSPEFENDKSAFVEVGSQEKVDEQKIITGAVEYQGLVLGSSWELHHEIRYSSL